MIVIVVNKNDEWEQIGYTDFTTKKGSLTFQKPCINEDRQQRRQEFDEYNTYKVRRCMTKDDGIVHMLQVLSIEDALVNLPNFKLTVEHYSN